MEIAFRDKTLAALETEQAASDRRFPISVIASFRKKLPLLRAAPDERTIRNWKSLHYEKLSGRGDERSIRLNDQWRLVFTLDTGQNRITVLKIEDYH